MLQQGHLALRGDFKGLQFDVFRRPENGADFDADGILKVVPATCDRALEGGGVAERLAHGGMAAMRRMAGWKPMSSMRSTSSSTRIRTRSSLTSLRVM